MTTTLDELAEKYKAKVPEEKIEEDESKGKDTKSILKKCILWILGLAFLGLIIVEELNLTSCYQVTDKGSTQICSGGGTMGSNYYSTGFYKNSFMCKCSDYASNSSDDISLNLPANRTQFQKPTATPQICTTNCKTVSDGGGTCSSPSSSSQMERYSATDDPNVWVPACLPTGTESTDCNDKSSDPVRYPCWQQPPCCQSKTCTDQSVCSLPNINYQFQLGNIWTAILNALKDLWKVFGPPPGGLPWWAYILIAVGVIVVIVILGTVIKGTVKGIEKKAELSVIGSKKPPPQAASMEMKTVV